MKNNNPHAHILIVLACGCDLCVLTSLQVANCEHKGLYSFRLPLLGMQSPGGQAATWKLRLELASSQASLYYQSLQT